ncbi:IPT/TIG domain-containing protein [Streptomyces sp. NPDC101234]|uniref:IPT/TIG domain-containing protein n=1 Tax=Streptomyces sp. NPDC101234 TaxID=3366138 RepID=UPI003815F0D7
MGHAGPAPRPAAPAGPGLRNARDPHRPSRSLASHDHKTGVTQLRRSPDRRGRRSPQYSAGPPPVRVSRCPPTAAPAFGDLKPKQGIPRTKFTISGSHFGDTQGLGTVRFGSTYAEMDSWSDTSISAYVPSGLSVATFKVSVTGASGTDAGGSSYDVMDPGPALSRTGWTATTSDTSPYNDGPGDMLDGNSGTRYSSGTGQYEGLWIQADMGQTQTSTCPRTEPTGPRVLP